jgi:hypothetical protein
MVNNFKHYYAIVDGGCWYIGFHLNREDAEKQAIDELNIHHSKVGYCIVDRDCLELICKCIKDRLKKDRK